MSVSVSAGKRIHPVSVQPVLWPVLTLSAGTPSRSTVPSSSSSLVLFRLLNTISIPESESENVEQRDQHAVPAGSKWEMRVYVQRVKLKRHFAKQFGSKLVKWECLGSDPVKDIIREAKSSSFCCVPDGEMGLV